MLYRDIHNDGGPGPCGRTARGACPARRRGGFTLTEIMIAMGILAVGMGMVAGALHAGIQVHLRTIDDIMRQLIADNSMAMVQARVRHSVENQITKQYQLLDTRYFGAGDLKYPTQDETTPYGAGILMKRRELETGKYANDYEVIVVPYTLIPPSGSAAGLVTSEVLSNCTVDNSAVSVSKITVAPSGKLGVGMVVIDKDGTVALVTSIPTATSATLDALIASGTGQQLTILKPPGTDWRLECSKPMRTKTALTPDPDYTINATP